MIRISPPEPRLLLGNRWLQARAESRLAQLRERGELKVAGLEFKGDEELHRPPYVFRKISMISSRRGVRCVCLRRRSVFSVTPSSIRWHSQAT